MTTIEAVRQEVVRRDGLFFESRALARHLGITARHLRRCLEVLRDRGAIELQTRRGRGGWCIARSLCSPAPIRTSDS